MKKKLLFMKMGIWNHFKKLISSLILIQALLLCLSAVVWANPDVSKKINLDREIIFTDDLCFATENRTDIGFVHSKSNPLSGQNGPFQLKDGPGENILYSQEDVNNKVINNLQQERVIKGKVTDVVNGEALPGVNIVISGTMAGTITDLAGNYSISVPDSAITLIFSSVGYVTENIVVGSNTIINVQLVPSITELDEMVVIGYQTVHKKRVTASVVSVPSDVLTEIPAASISTLLAGKAAGVQNLVRSGAPGMSGGGLLIRGNSYVSSDMDLVNGLSSPLYVVDGIPTTLEDLAGYDATNTDYLSSLNPADIESIDILKDASAAAIYGSRGANGVILITTKKGKVGEPEFHFNAYSGITVRPELYKVYTGAADRNFKLQLIEDGIPD